MISRNIAILTFIISMAILLGACDDEPRTPPRDQIPILKQVVFKLQEHVKERNRAAIDSMLSAKILDNQQSSDSLLSFVYGPEGDFAFTQFGRCDIFYTKANAEARCYVMDSSSQSDRPIRLSFIKDDTLWLLESFGVFEEEVVDTSLLKQ